MQVGLERTTTAAAARDPLALLLPSDLAIVLGSSLRVDPAASLPFKAKRRARVLEGAPPRARSVIVNLQPTPRDGEADLIIRARCDDVLRAVASALVEGWPADADVAAGVRGAQK